MTHSEPQMNSSQTLRPIFYHCPAYIRQKRRRLSSVYLRRLRYASVLLFTSLSVLLMTGTCLFYRTCLDKETTQKWVVHTEIPSLSWSSVRSRLCPVDAITSTQSWAYHKNCRGSSKLRSLNYSLQMCPSPPALPLSLSLSLW